ncbi:hypothetical protein SCHPADRAFT_911793 [Schizopora paradoxa]|uniref:Uncharacterized protein n=1 Tax=Schizopora paradoxa TaxID=27342 RepID=A0A0H2R3W6_9AGAM|nr:hypothetical protein SCHPADRAFT_911793 [Schizopora paradoxa]
MKLSCAFLAQMAGSLSALCHSRRRVPSVAVLSVRAVLPTCTSLTMAAQTSNVATTTSSLNNNASSSVTHAHPQHTLPPLSTTTQPPLSPSVSTPASLFRPPHQLRR